MCPMRPKVPPMKTKLAMLFAFAALVVGGDARAGVVLSNSATPNYPAINSWGAGGYFGKINFNNTSGSVYQLNSLTVSVKNNTGASITNEFGFIFNGQTPLTGFSETIAANATSSITFDLSSYNLYIPEGASASSYLRFGTVNAQTGLALGATYNTYSFTGSTWSGSTFDSEYGTGDGANYFTFSVNATAVPEPSTMILTGTALAAGAVGSYFKRRRKAKAEVAA